MHMDIIHKEDNTQKVFLTEKTLNVTDILRDYYPYLLDSIKKEGIILKYDECNLFKELVFDKKVVGFCTYDYSREFITAALSNIYVLPEFRGNSIFANELEKTMEEHNKPSIMEPTRLVVELLIKHGFAKNVNENIVASALEFVIPGNHVLSNSEYHNEELSTHFYDLDICSSIHVLDLQKGCVAYSSPLNYDIIHYDAPNHISDEYLGEITDFFKSHDVEIMNAVLDLEENLPIKQYSLEEVIGDEDNFSQYIETLIDDDHVTYQKALDIKNQIKEEYEAGMILNESLLIRLAYLFDEDKEPRIKSHDDVCPYCNMPIDSHDKFCHFCGINLSYDVNEMQDSLINSINNTISDFKEDIRFIAYKFLRLIDENIELEYSIFTIENTYNIHWHDLKLFLDSNNYFKDGKITQKGYYFLDNHPLHFWERYHMDVINYSDFENYFYENSQLKPLEICINYLSQFDDDEYALEIINEIKGDSMY
jgi:DNA-binding ferritin-like protein (Dps family)